jgi:hypothetical protein
MAMRNTSGFAVDTTGTEPLWRELSMWTGKSVPQLVREFAGLLARILASYTQPVPSGAGEMSGLTLGARNLGKAAVSRDLARVYVMPAAVFITIRNSRGMKVARQFSGLMKSGQYDKAEKLLQGLGVKGSALRVEPWDDGARHKRLRNKRGRISRGTKPVITTDPQAFKAHRKEKLNNVGFTKSSWYTAGKQIPGAKGLGRIPAWIKKHKAPGRGIDNTRGNDNPHIILESLLPWMETAFSSRTNNLIFKHFGDLVEKALLAELNYHRQKAEREMGATGGSNLGKAKAA